MFSFFLVGLVLVVPSVLVNWARKSTPLRDGIEKFLRLFLLGGNDSLFDPHKQYTWVVQWFQWAAIPTALMIVLPTQIIWDGVFGLGLAAAFYVVGKFFTKKFPSDTH